MGLPAIYYPRNLGPGCKKLRKLQNSRDFIIEYTRAFGDSFHVPVWALSVLFPKPQYVWESYQKKHTREPEIPHEQLYPIIVYVQSCPQDAIPAHLESNIDNYRLQIPVKDLLQVGVIDHIDESISTTINYHELEASGLLENDEMTMSDIDALYSSHPDEYCLTNATSLLHLDPEGERVRMETKDVVDDRLLAGKDPVNKYAYKCIKCGVPLFLAYKALTVVGGDTRGVVVITPWAFNVEAATSKVTLTTNIEGWEKVPINCNFCKEALGVLYEDHRPGDISLFIRHSYIFRGEVLRFGYLGN